MGRKNTTKQEHRSDITSPRGRCILAPHTINKGVGWWVVPDPEPMAEWAVQGAVAEQAVQGGMAERAVQGAMAGRPLWPWPRHSARPLRPELYSPPKKSLLGKTLGPLAGTGSGLGSEVPSRLYSGTAALLGLHLGTEGHSGLCTGTGALSGLNSGTGALSGLNSGTGALSGLDMETGALSGLDSGSEALDNSRNSSTYLSKGWPPPCWRHHSLSSVSVIFVGSGVLLQFAAVGKQGARRRRELKLQNFLIN